MIHLVRPSRGRITQRHGNKQSHNGLPHGGQDYGWTDEAGNVTVEVFAAADGVVVYAGDARKLGWPNEWYYNPDFDRTDKQDSSAGNVVVIRHKQGGVVFDTTYNHLESWSVKKDQGVKAGQIVATMGNTGFSFGRHLHFELLFHPFNFGTATYGRADPNPYFGSAAIAPQGTTTNAGGLTVADIDSIDKKLADILARLAPINTSSGAVDLRQFIADGTRAAQAAEAQTAPINVSGGQEGIRDFIAKGTRASQATAAKLAGLEAALKAVVSAAGSPIDLAAVTAAAEAGATKALSNLNITIEQAGK